MPVLPNVKRYYSNPGAKQDDEIMYGSGQPSDPIASGSTAPTSGPGSHLGSSNTTANDPASSASGYGSSNFPGNDPLSSSTEPSSTTGYGSSATGTGHHHDKNLATGYGDTGSDVNDPYSTSRTQGTFDDAATTTSIKSSIPGLSQAQPLTDISGTQDTLDINKPLPSEPNSGLSGIPSSTSAGPHSSNLANKADPRVDSDLDGSRGLGGNNADGNGLTGSSLPDRTVGK